MYGNIILILNGGCRSAYCDARLPPENLLEFLPRLIPVKLFQPLLFSLGIIFSGKCFINFFYLCIPPPEGSLGEERLILSLFDLGTCVDSVVKYGVC